MVSFIRFLWGCALCGLGHIGHLVHVHELVGALFLLALLGIGIPVAAIIPASRLPVGIALTIIIAGVIIDGAFIQSKETDARTRALEGEKVRLKSEVDGLKNDRADVSMIFEKKPPMYSADEQWYRVLVRNLSQTASAEGVDVQLVHVNPLPSGISNIVFPTSLGAKDKAPNESVRIPPGGSWAFDVINGGGEGHVRFWTKIRAQGDPNPGLDADLEVGKVYQVTLAVHSENPQAIDRNGEKRMFGLVERTGKFGGLEFYVQNTGGA